MSDLSHRRQREASTGKTSRPLTHGTIARGADFFSNESRHIDRFWLFREVDRNPMQVTISHAENRSHIYIWSASAQRDLPRPPLQIASEAPKLPLPGAFMY
jgi:hypothetical protein